MSTSENEPAAKRPPPPGAPPSGSGPTGGLRRPPPVPVTMSGHDERGTLTPDPLAKTAMNALASGSTGAGNDALRGPFSEQSPASPGIDTTWASRQTPSARLAGNDLELSAAAQLVPRGVSGRDPEASLDVPPPSEVLPPEQRGPDASDPYIGTTFDHRYKIQRLLGEGGMGFVYLARHKVIDKKVAVKVLRSDLAKDRENPREVPSRGEGGVEHWQSPHRRHL